MNGRRRQVGQRSTARFAVECDRGQPSVGVDNDWPSEGRAHRREVELGADEERGGLADGHTHFVAAEPLGFQLPTHGFRKPRRGDEHTIP